MIRQRLAAWVRERALPEIAEQLARAGLRIDYQTAVSGELQLAPDGPALAALADDYNKILADGMLLDDEAPFEVIMAHCAEIQSRANRLEPDAGNQPVLI